MSTMNNNPFKDYSKEELANLCWYQSEQLESMWLYYRFCALVFISSFVGSMFAWYLSK
jgi:hypothetical protein